MRLAIIGYCVYLTLLLGLEMAIVSAISTSFELKLGSMGLREDFREGKQIIIKPY